MRLLVATPHKPHDLGLLLGQFPLLLPLCPVNTVHAHQGPNGQALTRVFQTVAVEVPCQQLTVLSLFS
jgi:hypothetical protein